jgi:hypothetical protein
MNLIWRRLSSLCLPMGILAILTNRAEAHVKWFCGAVDVTTPPLALAAVLSPTLLVLGAASMTLVSAGGMVDTLALRRWPSLLLRGRSSEMLEEALIRVGVGSYMLLLWDMVGEAPWSTAGDGAVLTPELLVQGTWLGWLQLATAVMVVFRYTCPLAALGMLALYGIGVAHYGLFHMTDYTIFVGLAGYLALSHPFFDRRPTWQQWRVPLIAASLGFSLMWTGIEKFLYPAWAAVVLAAHPIITANFPASFVIVAAGFVEFSVAFYLLVGRSLLRVDAAIVIVVLLAAVPEFGALDTVGHIPFVAMLLVLVLHGPSRLQQLAYPRQAGAVTTAAWTAALYILCFATVMAMYYGLQKAGTWPA